MAQSALTVTPPSPTPPTNMGFTGATPPNPPNYTKATYADWIDNTKFDTAPPPYFDDGTAGSLTAFTANVAALASGTGATAGGTENTYPGAAGGVVPASTSVPHEGAGTEVVVTTNYQTGVTGNGGVSVGISSAPLLQTATALRSYTTTPTASHATSEIVAPSAAPTITGLLPAAPTATGGDTPLTVNGTNFRNGAVVNLDGAPQQTTYVSPTQLKVMKAAKRTTAGNTAVTVKVGTTTTAATNWAFT